MSTESQDLVVALDLNMLSLLSRSDLPEARRYDLVKERTALATLGKLTSPLIRFRHPAPGLFRAHRDYVEFVGDDFLDFKKSDCVIVGHFVRELDKFIDALKQKDEKQDDIPVLCFAAFCESRRIKRIVTADVKFINRISSIHGSLKNNKKMLDWVLAQRPDFFDIRPCLPSELLDEIQKV